MTNLWDDLLGCLDLLELPSAGEPGTGDGRAEQAGTDARGVASAGFEGRNQQLSYHRLFGGQLLAQFVRVASLTSPGKTVKSLHVLSPREGRSQEPVRYEVERHLQGSTFAALTIRAREHRPEDLVLRDLDVGIDPGEQRGGVEEAGIHLCAAGDQGGASSAMK